VDGRLATNRLVQVRKHGGHLWWSALDGVGSKAPGYFVNIFQVRFEPPTERLMTLAAGLGPSVSDLRRKYETSGLSVRFHFSAKTQTTYAYGPDREAVSVEGFAPSTIELPAVPDVARRLMLDGFVDHLGRLDYKIEWSMGRYTAVQPTPHWKSGDGRVRLFKGFDINSIMWSDPRTSDLCFGLVVDLRWLTRDGSGASIRPATIATAGLSLEVARAQGELLPGTARVNTEISRLLLEESILPFVKANPAAALGGGGGLIIDPAPVRVVVGAGE